MTDSEPLQLYRASHAHDTAVVPAVGGPFKAVVAGVMVWVVGAIIATSQGALLFSGPLAPYAGYGISMALFSAVVFSLVLAVGSSYKGTIAAPQNNITGIMSAALVALAAGTSADFTLAVGFILLTTLATGGFFILLGQRNLGDLIRFIPYPVMGGFLAASGWLIVDGSLRLMADTGIMSTSAMDLFDAPARWVPGVGLGVFLLILDRYTRRAWVMPVVMLLAVGAFYGVALGPLDMTIPGLRADGFLFASFSRAVGWTPPPYADLLSLDWSVLYLGLGNMITVLIVASVHILLNASGMELIAQTDIDLNRELKASGVANLLTGLGGGFVGYNSLSQSALAHNIGSRSRTAAAVAGGLFLLTLVFGTRLLSYFPPMILGGLQFYVGAYIALRWVVGSFRRLGPAEYLVLILILGVSATVGFIEGTALGILLTVIMFVVDYSRQNVIRQHLTMTHLQSNVERTASQRAALSAASDELHIYRLQGFIFFGTANKVYNRIRDRLRTEEMRYVLLDFEHVHGIDTSAALVFDRLEQVTKSTGLVLVLVGVSRGVDAQLQRLGFGETLGTLSHKFVDLDHALEWCEDRILTRHGLLHDGEDERVALVPHIADVLAVSQSDVAALMGYLAAVAFDPEEILIPQGVTADQLYYIESGRVVVQIVTPTGNVRLRTLRPGTIVGELAFYTRRETAAQVIAETPVTAHVMRRSDLARLRSDHPVLSDAFSTYMIHVLAGRLFQTDQLINDMLI